MISNKTNINKIVNSKHFNLLLSSKSIYGLIMYLLFIILFIAAFSISIAVTGQSFGAIDGAIIGGLIGLIIFIVLFSIFSLVTKMKKNLDISYNFAENKVVVEYGDFQEEVPYVNIKSVYETDDVIVFLTSMSNSYVLDTKGFDSQSSSDLIALLQSKNIKYVNKKKRKRR